MASPAGIYNLIVEQGATIKRSITWKDENGTYPDFSSGYTATLIIAPDYDTAADLTLTNGSGITLAAGGSIVFEITPTQSAALDAGTKVWRLDTVRTSDSRKDRILKGRCLVEAEAGA